jgi:hypothetical protein
MKTLSIVGAALASLMMAGSALAQDATSNITMSGSAANTCNVPTVAVVSSNGSFVPDTGLNGTFTFSDFANSTNATHASKTLTITYTGAMCNYAAKLGLQSTNGAMTSGLAAVSGFAEKVTYTAAAAWDGATNSLTADGSAAGIKGASNTSVAGPKNADLVVTVTTVASASPLLAGSYSDVLVVQVGTEL